MPMEEFARADGQTQQLGIGYVFPLRACKYTNWLMAVEIIISLCGLPLLFKIVTDAKFHRIKDILLGLLALIEIVRLIFASVYVYADLPGKGIKILQTISVYLGPAQTCILLSNTYHTYATFVAISVRFPNRLAFYLIVSFLLPVPLAVNFYFYFRMESIFEADLIYNVEEYIYFNFIPVFILLSINSILAFRVMNVINEYITTSRLIRQGSQSPNKTLAFLNLVVVTGLFLPLYGLSGILCNYSVSIFIAAGTAIPQCLLFLQPVLDMRKIAGRLLK